MVANNFLGFASNSFIMFALDEFFEFNSSKSDWLKEKSATSEPEIIAEKKSRIIIPIMPKSKLVSRVANN